MLIKILHQLLSSKQLYLNKIDENSYYYSDTFIEDIVLINQTDDILKYSFFINGNQQSIGDTLGQLYIESFKNHDIDKNEIIKKIFHLNSSEIKKFLEYTFLHQNQPIFHDNHFQDKKKLSPLIRAFNGINVNNVNSEIFDFMHDIISHQYDEKISANYLAYYFKHRRSNFDFSTSPKLMLVKKFKHNLSLLENFSFFPEIQHLLQMSKSTLDDFIEIEYICSSISVDFKRLNQYFFNDKRIKGKIYHIFSSVTKKFFQDNDLNFEDTLFKKIKKADIKKIKLSNTSIHSESMKNDILFFAINPIDNILLKDYLKYFLSVMYEEIKTNSSEEINWLQVFEKDIISKSLNIDESISRKLNKL